VVCLVLVTTNTPLTVSGWTGPSGSCATRFLFLVTIVVDSFPFPVVSPVALGSAPPSSDASPADCNTAGDTEEGADEDEDEMEADNEDEDKHEENDDEDDDDDGEDMGRLGPLG
jgi:hypothetical protein